MKYNYSREVILEYAHDLEKFILGTTDESKDTAIESFGRIPSQEDKDSIVRLYSRKISIVQRAAKELTKKKNDGVQLSEEELQIVDIMDKINSKYPPKRDILDIVRYLDEQIRGTYNKKNGLYEGGLNRRPIRSVEVKLAKDFYYAIGRVKKLEEKKQNGVKLTDTEQEAVELFNNILLDFPRSRENKTSLDSAKELDFYLNGDSEHEGLGRKPSESSENQTEVRMTYKYRHVLKVASEIRKNKTKEELTEDDIEFLKIADKIRAQYPPLDRNNTMLDSAKSLQKYMDGGFDDITNKYYSGIKKRPSKPTSKNYSEEESYRYIFENACARVRLLKSQNRALNEDELELIRIMDELCEKYPSTHFDTQKAITILTAYIYDGIETKDGVVLDPLHKRPAISSKDEFEKKMAMKLTSIRHRIDDLADEGLSFSDLDEDDIMAINFYYKLSKDYPSRKQVGSKAIEFCYKIIQEQAELENRKKQQNLNNPDNPDAENR
ncbi:MAG: hypothetical protein J6J36_01290 [Clostridia bacterium]|nr:hypothetical protein [Clostridia bacterium]